VRFEPYRYEREMTTAEVTLSSASLGDSATEDDFDAWVSFVGEHIDEATGLVVSVDAKRFGDAGDDDVMATLESNVTLIKEQLRELWDRWCSESLVASV
jgi:hypothetical protein